MEYWKIIALIGTLIFLFAGFLPYISTGFGSSRNLVSEYQDLGSTDWNYGFSHYPVSFAGALLLTILWPIALILGMASIFRRRMTLIAGIVGIVCWVGAVMYISGWHAATGYPLQYGAGVFTGFAGAIILLVAYYIKPTAGTPQAAPPPPPPPHAS